MNTDIAIDQMLHMEFFNYKNENYAMLASQAIDDLFGKNNQQNIGMSIIKALIKAFSVPLLQLCYAKTLEFLGIAEKKNNCDIYIFSFAKSHTDITLPIAQEILKTKRNKVGYLRASIGLWKATGELRKYFAQTGEKPGLIELFYDAKSLLAYYQCVVLMFCKVIRFSVQKQQCDSNFEKIDNEKLLSVIPEFFIYYVPLSYISSIICAKYFCCSPKAFIFGYDNCPRGKAYISEAKKHYIKTITVQHGIIANPKHYLPTAEIMVVWSEEEKRKLLLAGANKDQLVVIGSPKFSNKYISHERSEINCNQIVLALTRGTSDSQLITDVENILKVINDRDLSHYFELVVRPHPLDVQRIYKLLENWIVNGRLIFSSLDEFSDVIKKCCLGIVYYSTVVMDFALNNIPVVSILPQGEIDPTGFVDSTIVHRIDIIHELPILLANIHSKDKQFFESINRRREQVEIMFSIDCDKSVSQRIIEMIDL